MGVVSDEGLARIQSVCRAVALAAGLGVAASFVGVVLSPRALLSPAGLASRVHAAAARAGPAPAELRVFAWQRARVLLQLVAVGALVAPLPLVLLGDTGVLLMRHSRQLETQ